jgi:Protein of unknown function (DUF4238)
MATNKKHHYVPKFYLRNFATELHLPSKQRKTINQLDVKNFSWRHNISLRDQCHSPYLYGKDQETENLLKDFEGEFASLFRNLIHSDKTNITDTNELLYVYYFAIISIIRTPRQKRYMEDLLNKLLDDQVSLNFPQYSGALEVDYYDFYRHALASLNRFALSLIKMQAVVVNAGAASFITSDNPVVRHNQLLRVYNKTHPSLGFLSKGLQILIPISPKKMIILFDEDSYKLKRGRFVCTENDVLLLNSLQILNCDSSVYFSDKTDSRYINTRFVGKTHRNLGESEFSKFQHVTDTSRELLLYREIRHIPSIPLSFLKIVGRSKPDMGKIISPTRVDASDIDLLVETLEEELRKRDG